MELRINTVVSPATSFNTLLHRSAQKIIEFVVPDICPIAPQLIFSSIISRGGIGKITTLGWGILGCLGGSHGSGSGFSSGNGLLTSGGQEGVGVGLEKRCNSDKPSSC